MEINGIIEKIMDTQNVSDSFRKREFVVKTAGEYPQEIIMELTQDRVSVLDNYKVGDEVNVSINLRGRKWTKDGVDRWFNTIQAWQINKAGRTEQAVEAVENAHSLNQEDDSLPF